MSQNYSTLTKDGKKVFNLAAIPIGDLVDINLFRIRAKILVLFFIKQITQGIL